MYCLKECIFDPSHSPNEAAIIEFNSGIFINAFTTHAGKDLEGSKGVSK